MDLRVRSVEGMVQVLDEGVGKLLDGNYDMNDRLEKVHKILALPGSSLGSLVSA